MSGNEWKKENTVQYKLRITKASGIPDAISEVAEKLGIGDTTVIRVALMEKLQREGYVFRGKTIVGKTEDGLLFDEKDE